MAKVGRPSKLPSFLEEHQSRVNKIVIMQRNNDIISMLLEGKKSSLEIRTYLVNKYNINPSSASKCIAEARKIVKERNEYEINNIINLHIARYEYIYSQFYELGAFTNAAQALRNKENLMGFHRAGFHMRVTQGEIQQFQIHNVDDEYNVDKLPKESRERMSKLIAKMKRDPKIKGGFMKRENDYEQEIDKGIVQ